MCTTETLLGTRSAIHAFADRRAALALPCALIALGWAVALAAALSQRAYLLEHHYWLARPGIPTWAPPAVFLASWQVMLLAMMLPASLPAFTAIFAAAGRWRPAAAQLVFLLGYAVPWTAFGLAAYVGDAGLLALSVHWGWLATHTWVIGLAALLIAALYQLTPAKRHALLACRTSHIATRELADVWWEGRRHGAACVGAGWALMLIMFGFGMTSLTAMLALTTVMVVEQVTAWPDKIRALIGAALVALALLWSAHAASAASVAPMATGGAFARTQTLAGGATVTLRVTPAQLGANTFAVVVRDGAGKPVHTASATLTLDMLDMDMGAQQITLAPSPDGSYTGVGALVMPGAWQATVRLETTASAPAVQAAFRFTTS
jgi:predicted metal-binding membrane protein/nitrogen fixation protein FixH